MTDATDRLDEIEARLDELQAENEQLREENDELHARVDDLEAENEQLQERVDELEAQPEVSIEDDSRPIRTLEVAGAPVGRRITASITEYDWDTELRPDLEADLEASNPTPEAGETTRQQADLTHIEQISRAAGDDISSVTDSVDARRAVALWRNLVQWGKKTPKGYCLRPADNPVSLLEADQDENLCWKQYYRACEALEGLSEGAVTFCHSDRHGKMLVLHEQSDAFERATRSLSASSAAAEG